MITNNSNNAIILLSGGLDCTTALSQCISNYKNIKAITFDYGQKSFEQELLASKKICEFYNIKQEIITLDWLKELIKNSNNIWIPNRNSVFINICASYLDNEQGGHIIIGANKQEAIEFSDNSTEFINTTNQTLKYSCQNEVKAVAPLINLDKEQIIALALKNHAPLNLIYSCYGSNTKHCGKCKSCQLLKNALSQNNCQDLIQELFE